jgi:uncharacterized ferritin-like protein (DUF455 family)
MEKPDWSPFLVADKNEKTPSPRSLTTLEGIGDRLRVAAFAEKIAIYAFNWAINTFNDAPSSLIEEWKKILKEEQDHYLWLMTRMEELKINIQERKVSDKLYYSFQDCKKAKDFCLYMTTAEERGRVAGFSVAEQLKTLDPKTSEIFFKIAEQETSHVDLIKKFFPELYEEFKSKIKI